MSRKPVTSVLVKPAGPDCNLDCEYCFYSGKVRLFPGRKTRMSLPVLEAMIAQLMVQPVPQISIGWQGGEPTLMGIAFFRKALELMEQHGRGQAVANGLQTNGVLVDRQWAKLFRDYHFLIGVSLDGPEPIHNHYRRSHNGGGSWRKAVDAAKLLLDQGVEVNVLTVVNDFSVQFPEEIYTFHKMQNLDFMQFIPCVETDRKDPTRVAPFSVSGESYGKFLCKLFDLWLEDFSGGVPTTSIRFFEALLLQYAGFPPGECTLMEECGNYLVIEHNGDVYACDFFVEKQWKLGNLLENPLPALLNAPKQAAFGRLKADLPKICLDCEWRPQCRGGCTKDRLRDPMSDGRNHFCQAYKLFFPYADSRLRRLVEKWKRKQSYA
ncbi:MAG TPA: anaerobic sulfatase maturase [Anaerolineales bacterium]|nr:anaerobic sulfatase maturase [Anaerolineales bacterium]